MTLYVAREAVKLWRRIAMETCVELQIFLENWKLLLLGLIFQYIHGVAARGIHYLHRPGRVLNDLGFKILPELGPDRAYNSMPSICLEILLAFAPEVHMLYLSGNFNTSEYALPVWMCPNYHCREGSEYATLPPPESILDLFFINVRGVFYGCGDLIFSSHMIFTLVFVRTYFKYGSKRFIKMLAWLMAVIQSILIISSRKHYSVDVVVAWYTVNLVVFFIETKLPEMPDRNGSQPLLPLVAKEKDIRPKEESQKLLHGNSNDSSDRRYRNQVNGKHVENGSHSHSEPTKNGA